MLGYRPGKQNSVADTLSRREDLRTEDEERPVFEPFSAEKMIPVDDLEANEVSIEELEEMALALLTTDGNIQEDIREWIRQKGTTLEKGELVEGLWLKDGRIWVPPDLEIRRKLVELYHDSPFMGHL